MRIGFRNNLSPCRPTIGTTAFNRNAKTAALKSRVYLPTKLPGWSAFLENTVVPWDEVSDEDKAVYFENLGEDAPVPLGILKETDSSMGALRDQWLFNINVGQANGLTIFLR